MWQPFESDDCFYLPWWVRFLLQIPVERSRLSVETQRRTCRTIYCEWEHIWCHWLFCFHGGILWFMDEVQTLSQHQWVRHTRFNLKLLFRKETNWLQSHKYIEVKDRFSPWKTLKTNGLMSCVHTSGQHIILSSQWRVLLHHPAVPSAGGGNVTWRFDTLLDSSFLISYMFSPLSRKYITITALEQRQQYKDDFCSEYDEYRALHDRIGAITEMFVQLGSKINTLAPGTQEYKVLFWSAKLEQTQWTTSF